MSATTGAFPEGSSTHSELLGAYRALPGVYDALVDANGAVRPGWSAMLAALAGMSEQDRVKLNETAQRILRENGVTFVAQDDADSTSRPWRLDLFPMLIAPDEWQALETGLIQRARLLNELLGDLYGPQRTLKESVLPPSIVPAWAYSTLRPVPPLMSYSTLYSPSTARPRSAHLSV